MASAAVPILVSTWVIILISAAVVVLLLIVAGAIVIPLLMTRALGPRITRLQSAVWARLPFGSSISALRSLGFFLSYKHLNDFQLTHRIQTVIEERQRQQGLSVLTGVLRGDLDTRRDALPWNWSAIAGSHNPGTFEMDLIFVSADEERVWWKDRECVVRGAGAYACTLLEWSLISRDAFSATELRETWEDEIGPVHVDLTVNGQPVRFTHINGYDRFLDTVGLRDLLNPLIAASGLRFEICAPRSDPNVVVVLSEDERRRLESERGWRFVPPTTTRSEEHAWRQPPNVTVS